MSRNARSAASCTSRQQQNARRWQFSITRVTSVSRRRPPSDEHWRVDSASICYSTKTCYAASGPAKRDLAALHDSHAANPQPDPDPAPSWRAHSAGIRWCTVTHAYSLHSPLFAPTHPQLLQRGTGGVQACRRRRRCWIACRPRHHWQLRVVWKVRQGRHLHSRHAWL